jgi:hypothetical protein
MAALLTAKRRNYDCSSCQGIALVIFASKRSEIQVYFFAFFRFSPLFRFFRFKFFASLRSETRGKTFLLQKKQNSIFFALCRFPISFRVKKKTFLSIFSLNFCFATIFSLNFCLFYLRFRFRFLVFRIEVNHM